MADFTMLEGGGGGGHHAPSHSSKKGKLAGIPKPVFFIGAAILIMALLYIRSVTRQNAASGAAANTNVDPSQVDYPTNSTDVASQLQNNSDILQGQVTSTLDQFQAQMASDYGTQLTQLASKMDTLQGTVDSLNSHPNPVTVATSTPKPAPKPTSKPVSHPAPKPVSHPAPKTTVKHVATHKSEPKPVHHTSKPNYLSGVSKQHYATPHGGFHTSTSVTDFLKSKGYDASFNSRKKIAHNMGIKNYSGSASQNEAMLKHLQGK